MRFLKLSLVAMSAGCCSGALFAQTSPGDARPLTAAQITAIEQYAIQQYGLPTFQQSTETPQEVKSPPTPPKAPKGFTAVASKACAIPLLNVLPKNAANNPMPRVVPRTNADPRMVVAGLPTCGESQTPASANEVLPPK